MRLHAAAPRPPPTPAGALSSVLVLALAFVGEVTSSAASSAAVPDEVDGDAYAGTGCLFEGARYRPGQAVPVRDEPCLRCRCRRGAPVCRLRVCAPLPDPPPPGCVLLHRANACCPQLHCPEIGLVDNRLEARHGGPVRYRSDGPNKGCYLNGSLFAEGSALSSSTLCDYCYCVRGQQRCVRPQCVLPAPGCTPEYRDHTCCPTSYHCGNGSHQDGGGAGTSPSTAAPPRRVSGCTVDGRRYREGAQVKSVARGHCETCFCMRGRVRCAPLKCDLPLDGCEPVTAPGKCCPVSYDCSKSRVSVTKTISSASSHNTKASLSGSTKGENSVRSISFDARSNREISSKESKVKIETAHHQQHEHVSLTTQLPLLEESPTTLLTGTADNIAITLNTKLDLGGTLDLLKTKNNSVIPEKNKILPMIEAIINKTRQKDQDYDYDYNEPSLPPSLPNLRIIPFVAEDAVTPEKRVVSSNVQKLPESNMAISKESQDKIDNFYLFSPPVETEGGFVPREPAVDSPFHQQKYDTPITATQPKVPITKVRPPEVTIRTVIPEAVTPDPLLGNGGSTPCTSGGRRYRHGELLTGMGACRMCFCFDGGIVCQEPSCGAVPPGCSRAPAREPDQCCGSIVCGDEHRESPLLFADVPEAEPQRGHARVPERPPVIEPVPDLVPAFTSTLITKRPPTTTTTTTTTTAAPSTTEAAAASPSATTSSTTAPPSTTKSHRNKTSTTTTASPTKDKTALRTKTTTAKPARTTTTQRPSSTTAKTSTTTKASTTAKPLTTPAAVPSTSKPTTSTPPASPTGKPLTSTSTTANPLSSTTSSTTVKPPPPPPPSSTTTTRRPPPLRKERPTTPASFFDVLWGTEDESENEAQDKVDQDVEYHDFVSTNQHEQEQPPPPPRPAPAADEEDSFSFDKFLELFIQPDPPVTTPAAPSASPATVTTPTTTAPRTPAPSTTSPRSTTTAKVKVTPTTTPTTPRTTTTVGTASAPPMSSSTRAPPKKDAKPTATATPAANMTSPSSTAPTPPAPKPTEGPVKRTTTAPKPKPPAPSKGTTTARPPTSTRKPGTTTITRRPTTTPKATTRKPSTTTTTAAAPTTSTTTTTPSTTSTPAPPTSPPPTTTTTTTTVLPIATMRPSLLFGTNKHRPTFNADRDRDSYPPPPPATRRPPTTPPPSTSPALSGLSGLLKLAGCNIYGRMYRVGRIIQELSGPCLECRCTDVGVQCQPKC